MQDTETGIDSPEPPRAIAPFPARSSLGVAALLTVSGGFLDAFAYVGHGHVFANAMTANVVFLGMACAAGAWGQAGRHLPPLLAFMAGVCLARALHLPSLRRRLPSPAITCLGLEAVFLGTGACLPRAFPDGLLVPGIALVAAMQNSSFTQLEGWSYNSVVTTANLRRLAEGLSDAFLPGGNRAELLQARLFGIICCSFFVGVVLGALCTPPWHNLALWVPAALLAAAFVLFWRQDHQERFL